MDYNIRYQRFIELKKHRPLVKEKGYEFHHILPKCLGGSNKKDNLIKLTHKEHLRAHQYLAKMYKGEAKLKMEIALGVMKHDRDITRKTSLKLWEKKEYRQRQIKVHMEYAQNNREQYSSEMKRRWQDPEFRAKVLAKRRKIYDSPEWKEKCRQRNHKMWNDPSMRKKITSARWGV
jgi:hypothetical protein